LVFVFTVNGFDRKKANDTPSPDLVVVNDLNGPDNSDGNCFWTPLNTRKRAALVDRLSNRAKNGLGLTEIQLVI